MTTLTFKHLGDYLNSLRSRGKYIFTKIDALNALNLGEHAFYMSSARLIHKHQLKKIISGLYMIIPPEYSSSKTLPPPWFIHYLMEYLNTQYYVGLLSAAALHGSAHQAPQVFQVITNKKINALKNKEFQISFHYSKDFNLSETQKIKTPTGYINVSTPERTAFDLIKYMRKSGGMNHVALVISELAEVLNNSKIAKVGERVPKSYSQKLGYLLDTLGKSALAEKLHSSLPLKLHYFYFPRRSLGKILEKNAKWHILVNGYLDLDI